MLAGVRPVERVAFVHVDVTVGPYVSLAAGAPVGVGPVRQAGAGGAVPAGVAGAVVGLGAVAALPAARAGAGVVVQAGEVAGAAVPAGRAVAHVADRRLAQGVLVADGAGALEAGRAAGELHHRARAAVLALEVAGGAGVGVLAVLAGVPGGAPGGTVPPPSIPGHSLVRSRSSQVSRRVGLVGLGHICRGSQWVE